MLLIDRDLVCVGSTSRDCMRDQTVFPWASVSQYFTVTLLGLSPKLMRLIARYISA